MLTDITSESNFPIFVMTTNNCLAISKTLIALLVFLHPLYSIAAADSDHVQYFQQGMEFYADEQYAEAVDALSRAIALSPDTATYHHWLGKSYGRQAEQANLFKAYQLSRKTRIELETAVELDNRNIDALADLMEFYRQAPGFLGGGQDKANEICRRIQELQEEGAGDNQNLHKNPSKKC